MLTSTTPLQMPLKGLLVANAIKLNSTVYFFFGVFLGLTALVFFGDLVAFFAGLAAGFFAAAGFLAFGFAAFFSAAGYFTIYKSKSSFVPMPYFLSLLQN
jgi:hypothetical protein